MREPLISVVLPVYNGEMFLEDAIESIRNQTLQRWELVILDDGSIDSSLAICRSYTALDNRITVHDNGRNLGLAATMNRLVSMARGNYIAIQEQDDISAPQRLAWEAEVLESMPNIGLVSGIAAWIDDAGQVFSHSPDILVEGRQYPQDKFRMVEFLYTEQCQVVNSACMFRRAVMASIPGPFDENAKVAIDWQFFLHVAHNWSIWGIPVELIKLRRGDNHNSITRDTDLVFREVRRCIKLIYEHYRDSGNSPITYALYEKALEKQSLIETTWDNEE